MSERPWPSECPLHGEAGQEPWCPPFHHVEAVRCDHLGAAYVVEMFLHAGDDAAPARSHHIHFVREGRREVHVLADGLRQDLIDGIWHAAVAAMERGELPRDHEAQFHHGLGRTEHDCPEGR